MRSGFYGYGFNVAPTSAARMELSHSGAFELGAGTNFVILPSADVAIVALTNATPSGVPESLTAEFADLVQFGEVREDWYKLYGDIFKQMEQPTGSLVGQKPPANPAPAAPLASYVGTYNNDYWGPARVTEKDGKLHLALGAKLDVPLDHWDGNVFTYSWVSRKLAAGNDFQGHVRRQQADAGVLRHVRQRNLHTMTHVSHAAGLTDAEVAQRVADGKTNDVPTRAARSVSDIVRANVFTRINAILGVLLVIVLSTGSVINGAFGLLIIANSAIGIIQELRAKQTLDKLAIVGQAKPLVRRQSGTGALLPSEVVLDDIIELGPGDQIVVDGEVVEEANLEVDESLLTGEADPIAKDAGDTVMSGSFVVAGSGAYRATKVGREAYAAQARRGGQQVHPGEVRTAQRHQQDPAVHHLPAVPGRPADHLHAAVHHRRRAGGESVLRDGRRAGADGARGPGADDLDRVRRRRGPARAAPVPGQGAARDRGAGPRRRGVRRQDRHADRERHAGLGSQAA